jgi:hypothetical protein
MRAFILLILFLNPVKVLALSSVEIIVANISYADVSLVNTTVTLDLKSDHSALLKVQHAQSDQIAARNLVVNVEHLGLPNQTRMNVQADIKRISDKSWAQAKLNCSVPKHLQADTWYCEDGQYQSERIHLPFSLNLTPLAGGVKADLDFKKASFSDEEGMHAAEKLSGNLQLSMQKEGSHYRWSNRIQWADGELFWQPFYLNGTGHQLLATGVINDDAVTVESAKLILKDVGELAFNGQMRLNDFTLTHLDVDMPVLNLSKAYPIIFKPLLDKTAFDHAEMDGNVALKLSVRDAEIKMFNLQLQDVNIDDQNKKFAFYHINANVPWSYDDAKKVSFSYQNGHLLNLPLGNTHIQAEVNRYALTAPNINLPILDGALQLTDVSAAHIGTDWYWHLQAKLTPVSMENISHALNLPVMQGKASAEIPLVTYSAGRLTTDGEIALGVFNGTATVTNLTMKDPLGVSPQLNADIAMRQLDLGSLTRTYSFGAIEGKLDVDVDDLELQNWSMVRFDARVISSAGNYPKKISQRAVENISALGGAGAAAAIQRSFLQFFKQFNYEKMGLNCKLHNDVCEMSGIASTPQGYVIVKGSGIPSITVMGYNQSVGWGELLARIKRVTDGNSKAIVQ